MGILHSGLLSRIPGTQLIAISESNPTIRHLGSKILPRVEFYESAEEMKRYGELDAIFITTPIGTHAKIVSQLTKDRVPVGLFVEKPLAAKAVDAELIARSASAAGCIGMTGFQKRFQPQYRQVKYLIDTGAIGDVNSFTGYSRISSVFKKLEGWRFTHGQGGALLDLGPHLIDLLSWYLGPLKLLDAEATRLYSTEVEDQVHARLEGRGKSTGKIEISWSTPGYRVAETRIEIEGSGGSIIVSDDVLVLNIVKNTTSAVEPRQYVYQKPVLSTGVGFLLGEPEYYEEDLAFVNSVRQNVSTSPSLVEGVEVSRLISQIHEVTAQNTSNGGLEHD